MDPLFLLMRLLHVGLGVFWAGTIIFVATLLMPSVRDAGPDGGKVMLALMRRGYMAAVPIAALLTLLSGFWLYWRDMQMGGAAWAGSASARVYGVGALAALIAFGLGITILRPTGLKLRTLMETAQAAPEGPTRAAILAEMAGPRARMASATPWVGGLLALATVCMAVARYL